MALIKIDPPGFRVKYAWRALCDDCHRLSPVVLSANRAGAAKQLNQQGWGGIKHGGKRWHCPHHKP